MANRFPLIVDPSDGNRIKELPPGDNLDLSGSDLTQAKNISATGTISASDILIGGQRVSGFSGDYNDLINIPTPISTLKQLTDVTDSPTAGHVLATDGSGNYTFQGVQGIGELNVQSNWNESDPNSDAFIANKPFIFSGRYPDLADKPVIPVTLLDLGITDGSAGDVLQTDGSGNFSFVSGGSGTLTDVESDRSPQLGGNLDLNGNDITGAGNVQISGGISATGNVIFGPSDQTGSIIVSDALEYRTRELTVPRLVVAEQAQINQLASLQFATGGLANEISDDGTLQDASTSAIPTENAVKIYVDSKLSASNNVAISDIQNTNPTSVTTSTAHQLSTGQVVTFSDIDPSNHYLNGNVYYAQVLTSSTFALYSDSALTTPVDGPDVYTSGGVLTRGSGGTGTFDQDLNTTNSVIFDNVTTTGTVSATSFTNNSVGVPTVSSSTNLDLDATNLVRIVSSPLRLAQFTQAQRDLLTPGSGDLIYNSTSEKAEVYQENSWQPVDNSAIGDLKGSVFGDDSTLIVDAVNNLLIGNLTGNVTGDVTGNVTGNVTGDVTGNTTGYHTGDVKGSIFADDSSIMVDAVNNTLHATSFAGIGINVSLIDTSGIGPLQIKAGATTDTGNTIFINPYGSNTFIQSQAETHTWSTGPYLSTTDPYIQFKTEGAFEALRGAYFVGDLTGTVTGGLIGDVFGDDSTLLIDATSKLVTANVVGDVTGTVTGNLIGNIEGSVFGDDSTLIVDGINNNVVLANNSITDLGDVDDTLTPTTGQVLKWDGAKWSPANDIGSAGGSGSDADTLDGFDGSYYLDYNNFSNIPTIPTDNATLANGAGYITDYTVTSGDVTAHQGDLSITEGQIVFSSDFIELTDLTIGAPAAASGSGGIAYLNTTGEFTYTPPDLSSYLTSITSGDVTTALGFTPLQTEVNDLSASVTWANIPDANVPSTAVTQHQALLSITESQISDLGTYLTDITGESIGDLSDVDVTSVAPNDGEALVWNNTDSEWQPGTVNGLQTRTTGQATTASIADDAIDDVDITGAAKAYMVMKIQTDQAAWVRLYVNDASRTADASRSETTDPSPDSGVITEVITSGAETVLITPGAYGFNDETVPTDTIPMAVKNLSGGTTTVTVTLTYLQLEA